MTHRIRENFFAAEGRLVTIMGNTMPPRDPNDDDDDETRTKTTTPNRTTNRRSSENPTRTNKRQGSCNNSPA